MINQKKLPVPVATNRTLVPPLTTNRALATVPNRWSSKPSSK